MTSDMSSLNLVREEWPIAGGDGRPGVVFKRTDPTGSGNHMLAGAARGRGWLLVPDAASIPSTDPKNELNESSRCSQRCSLQDIFVRFHCLH